MHSASSGWLRGRASRITTVLFIACAAFLLLPLQPVSRATASDELRVYVSLPKKGANADTSRLISKGLKAAVRAQGHRVRGKRLRLIELNDARGARWHPGLVRRNAKRAVNDPAAIAYVGELNSEATAVAKPIIERSGMAMFAPVATADSLTASAAEAGSSSANPPTLFRAIPNDSAQAVALVTYLRRSKARRFILVDDGALYGRGLAAGVAKQARQQRGLRLLGRHRAHRDGKGRSRLVRRIAAARPQAVLFAGSQSSDAAPLFRALHRAMPKTLLFGGDALAHDSFARQIGPAQKMARLVQPSSHIDPRNKPLRRLLGYRPDPVTVFAFDGMNAILRAIKRADAGRISAPAERRAAVREALFGGQLERGAVGLWKIMPSGDSSNGVFDAIRLRGGRAIEPAETAARRHLRRQGTARSSSTGPFDPSLLTSMDIETVLRMVHAERVRLLDAQLKEQIKAVQQRNEAVSTLNALIDLINRLRAHFPADAPGHSRVDGLPGWDVQDSEIQKLAQRLGEHPRLDHLTGSDGSIRIGSLTRVDIETALERIKAELDGLHNMQQMDMLRLQSLSNKRNEAFDVMQNFIKKMNDNRFSIIDNMR